MSGKDLEPNRKAKAQEQMNTKWYYEAAVANKACNGIYILQGLTGTVKSFQE